jgi:hypothetical protein
MPVSRPGNYFLNIRGTVEAFPGITAIPPAVQTAGTYFGKERVCRYRQPPALIVGKVPVEFVDMVEGKGVDKFFDKFHRIKMPGNIQHESPPGETGPVFNFGTGDFHVFPGISRKKNLTYCLEPVVDTRSAGRFQVYRISGNDKPVCFFLKTFVLFRDDFFCTIPVYRTAAALRVVKDLVQDEFRFIPEQLIPGYEGDAFGTKAPVPVYQRLKIGNNIK